MQHDYKSKEKDQLNEALTRWVEQEGGAWFQNVSSELTRTYDEIAQSRAIPVDVSDVLQELESCQKLVISRVCAAITESLDLQQSPQAAAPAIRQAPAPAAEPAPPPAPRAKPAAPAAEHATPAMVPTSHAPQHEEPPAEDLFPELAQQNMAVRRSSRAQWSNPVDSKKMVREPRPDQASPQAADHGQQASAHTAQPAPAHTAQPALAHTAQPAQQTPHHPAQTPHQSAPQAASGQAQPGVEELAMVEMLKGVAMRLQTLAEHAQGEALIHGMNSLIESMSQPGCLNSPTLRHQFMEMATALADADSHGLLQQAGLSGVAGAFDQMGHFFRSEPSSPAEAQPQPAAQADGRAPVLSQGGGAAAGDHPFAQNLQSHFNRQGRRG
uniref:Uncharacterized protein n=1 Tax=Magnetococcus massalia (strain MO-1) TaxID=451514 RepID=A0A1S7LFA0_MAGMO|nr:Conserved protein of unknown function. Similar to protein Mmc1_2243 from MC-1 [Candidatus Magnetococcus massalia]